MTKVLLFVPGLLGSELLDDEGMVWPGSLYNGIVGFDEARFQRLLNPKLTLGEVIGKVGYVVDIYAQWLKAFSRLRNKKNRQAMFSDADKTLYTAPYDWRIDLTKSAEERLAPKIREIDADWNGKAEIHIVAHSMGGLVTRYYLQSGKFANEPGFAAIRSLTTFGTPHNGAPVALAGALGLHAADFLSAEQSKRLANDSRYAALYQTFPLQHEPIIWKREDEGGLEPISLSDRAFAVNQLKLDAATLDLAQAFREAIDIVKMPIPAHVRTFLMIGTRFSTITHFVWNGGIVDKIETDSAGDGTVSLQGAFLPGHQIQFTDKSHVGLITAYEARLAFQELFDADGLLAAEDERFDITVQDVVVAIQAPFEALIQSSSPATSLQGELSWERAVQQPGKAELDESDFKPAAPPAPKPIRYTGPPMGGTVLRLTAPATTGIYRLVLTIAGQSDSRSMPFMVRPS
ncbi:hypothetical protein [Bradyrhizobium sp. LTSP857]|uniref:esterase/lipase family protein n=1 Tax=Bradyrhizobium sp. LTSP857 TaxID=1619231 RepID=UPI0005D1A6B7|nr:hypothetical protein [Bradyrhizobium sp. LTSP857]KJC34762.1 hypothetical protein UP06_35405 [Bradyrhizobium sp. LTSP857]